MSRVKTSFSSVILIAALMLSMMVPASVQADPLEDQLDHHVLIFTATTQFRHADAINQGTPALQAAFEAAGISSEHTEDSTIFNDADLARFDALVMFQTSGDPWSADEKAALERYQQAGGGIAAIHNASDMRGNYAWWDDLIGALMPSHAATGSDPGLQATVQVEDQVHPSTEHLPTPEWVRNDEWYNFSANVRGNAHVLLTMDESTYNPGGDAMGYDHPIAWCKNYDGGRAWVTAMGHFGSHYHDEDFVAHIVGGVQYAAGAVPGDCGGTVWDQFERVPLDQDTSAPFAMDLASDGRVFFTELVRGQIRVYHPTTDTTTTAVELDVYGGGEDGLLGISLDPNFDDNGHLFVYWSPASDDETNPDNFWSRISRFTVDGNSQIDPATEKVIIEIPARRQPDEPGHTGGGLDFDLDGNILLSVGDDVNPHSEPSPSSAPLSEIPGTFHDARATSANTNDLRGKLLRITPLDDPGDEPGVGSTYEIPAGNMFDPDVVDHSLFPDGEYDPDLVADEVYAMGFRNPFRFAVDPHTGAIGLADYGPDSGNNNAHGPAGMVSWSYITEPGNYGWPLCHGDKRPYRDVDFTTSPWTIGDYFDCDNPINDSVRNTGLTTLPPVTEPDLVYGYQISTVPQVIPAGGGLSPMGGPFYDYDPDLNVDTKFPEYYDGKAQFYEWSKNRVWTLTLDKDAEPAERLVKINNFLPQTPFLAPIDMKYGPDGSLYVLDWGGGFGRHNPNSGLYRIDYLGARVPVADIDATPTSGMAPLEVSFSGAQSSDPDGSDLTYEWDFDDDGTVDSTEVSTTHTYTDNGTHIARLTVTNDAGATGSSTVSITVGNTAPTVEFDHPVDGGFFQFGDALSWEVNVTDPEDPEIDNDEIAVVPGVVRGNITDYELRQDGPSGSIETDPDLHNSTDDLTYILEASYSDKGTDVAPPLTTTTTYTLQPKRKHAVHHDGASGVSVVTSGDTESASAALGGLGEGDWARYAPVNFTGIDEVTFRVASAGEGGGIELRRDSPDGDLLGSVEVPDTGGHQNWVDVTVDAPTTDDTIALYLVFTGEADLRLNFFEADGQGLSTDTRPQVTITSPESGEIYDSNASIEFVAEASDDDHDITVVEFYADDEKIGEDSQAPYSVTWDSVPDGAHTVHARATNSAGLTSHSRSVHVLVGDEVIRPPWRTFAARGADFRQTGEDSFVINAQGSNMWSGTDEYGAVYLPGAGDDQFFITVQLTGHQTPNSSAKAGLIVRNDVADPGVGGSGGYFAVHRQGSGNFEALWDESGDGTPDTAGSMTGSSTPVWVAIGRDGNQFTAYASNDGEQWQQFAQTTIGDAADTVDVGMFVTAHHASSYSQAEFESFTLSDDLPDPSPVDPGEPGEPTWPTLPPCVGLRSDYFDGDTLDTDRWSVRGAPGDEPRIEDGALVLPITNGDINEGETGPISFIGQDMPVGEWEATVHVDVSLARHWQHVGLMQHVDDDNYVKFSFTHDNSGNRFFEFQTETNGSRSWHFNNQNMPGSFPTEFWMRLTSDGSELSASYSTDGENFETFNGSATPFDGGQLGIVGAGDTESDTVDATIHSFVFAPDEAAPGDTGPNDEFDGDALNPCIWDRVVRYNPDTLSVSDGQLQIVTEPGDINSGDNTDPRNFVLQTAPTGDWTIETKVHAPLSDNWQHGGLLAYADDGNYVKLDIVADNQAGATPQRRVELRSEMNDQILSGPDIEPAPSNGDDEWWLRLTKEGDTFSGQVSIDGVNWTDMPDTVTNTTLGDDYGIGLIAIGPEQSAPVTISFDYFRLGDEEPIEDGVEASLDPSEPTGENGWYVDPVTLTLETNVEGAETQWREVGDEEWMATSDPVDFDVDGVYDLEYRATTGDGPGEDPVINIGPDFFFHPDDVTTEQGSTVTFDWQGGFHNAVVFDADGNELARSGAPSSDWETDFGTTLFEFEAAESGQFYFICEPHASNLGDPDPANWTGMVGSLQVEPSDGPPAWTSETGEISFQLDQAAPETEAILDGDQADGAYVGEVSLTLTATDETSGVAETHYREEGDDAHQVYDTPLTFTEIGEYVIEVRSVDEAGNVEDWQQVNFEIVEEGPDVELDLELSASTRCVAGNVFITVTARNDNEWPVDIEISSGDHGPRVFTGVVPGRFASHAFNTRTSTFGDGSATIRATAVVDGTSVTIEESVDFVGTSCG